jgi:hypothetical protein
MLTTRQAGSVEVQVPVRRSFPRCGSWGCESTAPERPAFSTVRPDLSLESPRIPYRRSCDWRSPRFEAPLC